jgi:hypothetical protein
MPQIKELIDEIDPHLVMSASKGSAYLTALWETGMWKGPSVMINCHTSCKSLPDNCSVVVAHGSNDEVYPYSRDYLEQIIRTGSDNRAFLFYTANSGRLPSGQHTRVGDMHNQSSLLLHDCLPRLMDAALSDNPELTFVSSWRARLSYQRLSSEGKLGYTLEHLRQQWVSKGHKGKEQNLVDVPVDSNEYENVITMFMEEPTEKAAYCGENYAAWRNITILKVERVENVAQLEGNAKPYFDSLKKSLVEQGIAFEPGVHTRWAFHGTDAIDSIVNNPVAGFQPLASGSRGASLWGLGTYFARDAKYVAEGGFSKPLADGTYKMLVCLVAIGMPCLCDPQHRGVMPVRKGAHCYNSSVDHLANPEIFILQHAGAAFPAYVISFA